MSFVRILGCLTIRLVSHPFLNVQEEESEFWRIANVTVLTFGKMSVLLVLCLALDRWYAVVQPIRYRYNFTKRRVFLYVAIILIIAASCNTPNALLPVNTIRVYFEITEVIVMVFIPVLLTWIIFVRILVHSKASPALQNAAGGKMKSKLLRMCSVTAFLLTTNWLPLKINRLIVLIQTSGSPSTPLIMIAMANSCVNH